jgi:serine/threonine protein kinase
VYFEDLGRQVIGHRTTRQVKMRRVPLASGATFAGFTIVRLLGSGGTGGVYLAEHPRIVRRVAFKLLRADVSAEPDWPGPVQPRGRPRSNVRSSRLGRRFDSLPGALPGH